MAEMMATRKKSKVKKTKFYSDAIPDLPNLLDLSFHEVNDNKVVELERSNEMVEESVKFDMDVIEDVKSTIIEKSIETIDQEIIVDQGIMIEKPIEIERLYPSIKQSLSSMSDCVVPQGDKNSLDFVTEHITRPVAPVEEWRLPDALPWSELMYHYDNELLDRQPQLEAQFAHESRDSAHPLEQLITDYQRSARRLSQAQLHLTAQRSEITTQEPLLWHVTERSEWREARCRDNAVVRRSVTFDEARFNAEAAQRLRGLLQLLSDQSLDEHALLRYETALCRALVDDCLIQVEAATGSSTGDSALRQCLCVLFRCLRAPPELPEVTTALRDWLAFLGSGVAQRGSVEERLRLLWELMRSPAGVGRWAAGLIQPGHDTPQSLLAALAMLLGGPTHDLIADREVMLRDWRPSDSIDAAAGGATSSDWAIVDSDGEDDSGVTSSWAMLRESDLLAFLNQIPLAAVYRDALDMRCDGGNDEYKAARGCHPSRLLRVMAFSARVVGILNCGLDNYSSNRYKALNKRISRLLRHTIQFLTDHLEAVLCTSVLPQFDQLFPHDTRMRMLAQYESIYEHSLTCLLKHRLHGNWQYLTDLPWRMLSPQRKWVFLTVLIDHTSVLHQQSQRPADSDWWLAGLQSVIDSVSHDDAIYLLTAISNIALEARPFIASELQLLTTVSGLLFQICYVLPSTRASFSKVGRELLSSVCLQHPQALSIILDAVKLWHPTVGQMGLFLFRELPFCLMVPSDAEFRLLSSWLLDNAPATILNQLGRHVFSNFNWGFATADESVLYLPLALHQRMATLLVTSFKRHTMDSRSGPWFVGESIKLVTYLWWNQEAIQDQSFHSWCLSLSIRLRLHPSTRYKVVNLAHLQPSSVINTSEWTQPLAEAQQERCSHPIAMYMAVTTWSDSGGLSQSVDSAMWKIVQNMVVRHQQYRLCLELVSQIVASSTQLRLSILLTSDVFLGVWRAVTHADDTYYNMVKSLISKQFPGPVLACIGNSFCPSLLIANGDKDRQEVVMKFFIQSVVSQPNWYGDSSFLWILDRLLEVNTALDLKTGSVEMYAVVKQYTEKQFADASKRSGLAQMLRLGGSLTPIMNQLCGGDYLWVKSFLLEAQSLVEDEMQWWSYMLHKLFIRKKREPRSVNAAMASACKHLRLGMTVSAASLVIVQAAQILAVCPADHPAIIKVAAVFFQRYLGFARVWNSQLAGLGSAGHRIFQDDAYHPLLQQARAAISAARRHHETQLDTQRQANPANVAALEPLATLVGRLDMLLLWVDEPRLHLEDTAVAALPSQYRADLLNLARVADLGMDALGFPRRALLEQARHNAGLWDVRHDLDFRFVRLAGTLLSRRPAVPIDARLLQRFNRQQAMPALCPPATANFTAVLISPQAVSSTTQILEFVGAPLSTMYECAAKHKANKNFLADLDKKYMNALSKLYELRTVNQSAQIPCHRGTQACTGHAMVNLNLQTWVKRTEVTGETSRNRQDFNQLVDEMLMFANLDKLVRGVLTMQHLVMKIDAQLQCSRNQEEFKKVVDCGLVLFFHLGRQINPETQKYPPHHMFVTNIMESIGSKFMKFASNQASVLLHGMLDNDLLVEVYGPHFCPNSDTAHTSTMYTEVIDAYEAGKCSQKATCTILSKFNIVQYLESSPSTASKMNMVDALITAIGRTKPDTEAQLQIDGIIEESHVNNLVTLLSANFSSCFTRVMEGFRSLCEAGKLAPRFWRVVTLCVDNNVDDNCELVLTIDEIRLELENMGTWLNKRRFSDALCKSHGLYVKYGEHAMPIVAIYGRLLESIVFKMTRSASENIASWQEVVEKIWDWFLKIYIPWIQSFAIADDNSSQPQMKLPWRVEDQKDAERIVALAMERLNVVLAYISNKEAQSFLLHCVLIWIANGLLLLKELPVKPYHEIYCLEMKVLQWQHLQPSVDCIKVICELICRPWMSEQCKVLTIEIASQVQYHGVTDADLLTHLFDMFVHMVCKTKNVFKLEAVERLTDTFIELNWNRLQSPIYRRGMEQFVANLEPRIILCNQTTIEGKIIKFLNLAAGCIPANGESALYIELAIDKQTIYVSTVVKLLSIAFSFTQTKNPKSKTTSGDSSQVKLFQLRISGLFTEIESVILQVTHGDTSQRMAISLLTEVTQLFRNQSIAELAIDPAIGWLQESRSSPLVLPFLIVIFRCGLHMSSQVRLAQQLMESYILSDQSDGGPASWATINSCSRLDQELQQQFWKESVRQGCMLCLGQQVIAALPTIALPPHIEQWQSRIVDWLEQTRPQGDLAEHSIALMIFLFLQLLLVSTKSSVKPGSAFKNFIQLLLKLSESKATSGFLGKVGLGKKSNFSFEFRMLCRSLSVFLHVQLPTNNALRVRPNDPGAITSPDMTVSSRQLGEALPTNKTFQNLEWLKSQRLSKELSPGTRAVLDSNIAYICHPQHCVADCADFMRQMSRQLWPDNKLLHFIYHR